jgi:hypothetical protein
MDKSEKGGVAYDIYNIKPIGRKSKRNLIEVYIFF